MAREYKVRSINSGNLAWHFELGEGENADSYAEWFWLDGQTEMDGQSETVYHFSLGLFSAMPNLTVSDVKDGAEDESRLPAVDFRVVDADGKLHRIIKRYSAETFTPDEFGGGAWGAGTMRWNLTAEGMPGSCDIDLDYDDMKLKIYVKTIAVGVQFSDQEQGFTYYHPEKKTALGWWPLAPRAEISGTLTFKGKEIEVNGLGYIEKQITNLPASFGGGAQNMWHWGHFHTDEFTAVWTDSAASKAFGFRHFSPVAVFRNSELVFSSFQTACCVEQFEIHPVFETLYPAYESLRAWSGDSKLFVQHQPGRVIECHKPWDPELGDLGLTYVRQTCPFDMLLKISGESFKAKGTATREWGAGPDWFPFDKIAR